MAKDDWAAPATRGELRLLEGKIDRAAADLDRKINRVAVDLGEQIKDVARDLQIGMANMETSVGRAIWIEVGALGAVGILFRFF